MLRPSAWRLRGISILLGLGSLLWIAGCEHRPPLLRLSLNEWPGFAYFRLAEKNDHVDRSAVRLKIYSYRNQADQIQRYVRGDADAVAVTLGDTLLICAKVPDRCPVIVFVVDESRGGDQLLARPGFDTLSSLKNQPIGLENSALAIHLIHRIFERYDLTPPQRSQLHFLPQESFYTMLKYGAIKAVLTYPPTSSLLQERLDLRLVVSTRDLPGEVLDVLAVAPDYLRRHPEAVAALIDGWRQARVEEQDEPDEVMVEMAALIGIHPDELRSEKKGLLFPGPQEQYQMLSDRRSNLLTPLGKEKGLLEKIGLIGPMTPMPRVDSRFIFRSPPGQPGGTSASDAGTGQFR